MLVCPKCFNDKESELIEYINSSGQEQQCEICSSTNENSLELDELLDFFETLLGNFQVSETGILLREKIQEDWNFFSSPQSADTILKEVVKLIKTDISLTDKVDYVDSIRENTTCWNKLKDELRQSRRFFPNPKTLKCLKLENSFNLSYQLDSNTELYRARVHHKSGSEAYKPEEMMAPESQYTTSGRANPSGIPFLYLSENEKTVVYEVRASYLDELSIGVFKAKSDRKIEIVDFSEQDLLYQPDTNIDQIIESQLLRNVISDDLSKPMRRYDSKLEYISTQFICEFIKFNTTADGIRFNSSLYKNGRNLVIFNDDQINCQAVSLKTVKAVDFKIE